MPAEREPASNAIVLSADHTGLITSVHGAVAELLGYDVDELVGQALTVIIPLKLRELHVAAFRRHVATGERHISWDNIELPGLHKSGEEVPLTMSLSRDDDRGFQLISAALRPVDDPSRAAARARSLSYELKARNAELNVLYEISLAINRSMELGALLDGVLATLVGMPSLQLRPAGAVFLVDDGELTLAAHLGQPEAFVDAHCGLAVGQCLCGLVARSGELMVAPDPCSDPRHTLAYAEMEAHGHIIVPLKSHERTVGVLCLNTHVHVEIDDATRQLFSTLGHQLGMAVENALLYETTRDLSLHDPLTGLANRRLLEVFLERGHASIRRSKRPFSVIMADIDHFKRYNDEHGHAAGDVLLAQVARVIADTTRQTDLAVRFGGEEFLVLLPDTERGLAVEAAERVRRAVSEQTVVTISLGVACCAECDGPSDAVICAADRALYRAKAAGRDRVVASDEDEADEADREAELHRPA